MPEKAQDLYSTFGSVPTNAPDNPAGGPENIHASPEAFGAQVGEAKQALGEEGVKVGAQGMDIATQYAKMATEAKVNDDYANKYVPAVAAARNQFDMAPDGPQKQIAYDNYLSTMHGLANEFGAQPSAYGKQIASGLAARHVEGETMSAARSLSDSQTKFQTTSDLQMAQTYGQNSLDNYNNPQQVESNMQAGMAHITKTQIDNGADPSSPEAEDQRRTYVGDTTVAAIGRAQDSGDVAGAYKVRQQYGHFLRADQQQVVDDKLRVQAAAQNAHNDVKMITSGQYLPDGVGYQPIAVRAALANGAHAAGVDPNDMLTASMIESHMGKNVGPYVPGRSQGDVLQTGKGGFKQGVGLDEQVKNGVADWKSAADAFETRLNRIPNSAETYITYQQGNAGGPALIKAAESNSPMTAIQVLTPHYVDNKYGTAEQQATRAILNNGGTRTMTAGDFTTFLKQQWDSNYAYIKTNFPTDGTSPGSAITAAHSTAIPAVQPASNEQQAYDNLMARHEATVRALTQSGLPIERQQKALEQLKQVEQVAKGNLDAHNELMTSSIITKSLEPGFTSLQQLSPDEQAVAARDYSLKTHLLSQIEQNTSGGEGKQFKEYGSGYINLSADYYSGKIQQSDLVKAAFPTDGSTPTLTPAGFNFISSLPKKEMSSDDAVRIKSAMDDVRWDLTSMPPQRDIYDKPGRDLWGHAQTVIAKYIRTEIQAGTPATDLTDPENPKYIGNVVKGMKRSTAQTAIDLASGEHNAVTSMSSIKTYNDALNAYQMEADPVRKDQIITYAKQHGLIPVSKNQAAAQSFPEAPTGQ